MGGSQLDYKRNKLKTTSLWSLSSALKNPLVLDKTDTEMQQDRNREADGLVCLAMRGLWIASPRCGAWFLQEQVSDVHDVLTHQSSISVSSQTPLAHAWHSYYTTLLSIGVDGGPLSISAWTAPNDTS